MTVVEIASRFRYKTRLTNPLTAFLIQIFANWNASMRSKESATQRGQTTITCSSCGRPFRLEQTKVPPFCSERCKMIDLGRWLDEEVGVPHEGGPAEGQVSESDQEDAD